VVHLYSPLVADLPLDLPTALSDCLASALDVEGKIPRALDALGPIADRDVGLLSGAGGLQAGRLAARGARVRPVSTDEAGTYALADDSIDMLVACWSAFRGHDPVAIAEAERILRPGGRLLVVHDYGRDDVSQLYADTPERPEYSLWSRRDGPFLGKGFKIRVVHCWWTFEGVEIAREFLIDAFGEQGRIVAAELKRPRLSYNVAIYHRAFVEPDPVAGRASAG